MISRIGTDLFWRPLWTLFIALALWPYIISQRRSVHYKQSKQIKILLVIVIVVITLFIFSNLLYMRLHLVSSSVYTHEALTVNIILKSSVIEHLQDTKTSVIKVVVVDSPHQPAYEVYKALTYLSPDIRIEDTILVLQPTIKSYTNLTYLNGLAKLREYNILYISSVERKAREILNSYIFASTYDISLVSDILTSKNVIFNLQDIIMAF